MSKSVLRSIGIRIEKRPSIRKVFVIQITAPHPHEFMLLFVAGSFMSDAKAKNTICLWFNNDAQDAAHFYAAMFPDSKVTAIRKAPGDFPGGKEGQILTVEFTVLGIPCIG